MPSSTSPIGVFDSGIGGLSVLQALRHELPQERYVYLADSGNAPYGDSRGDAFVQTRTRAIAQHLLAQHDIKALVIACNTATAAAVELLREEMPQLPLIGVEPAIKPASLSSQTHHVGVMATHGTVSSKRFTKLIAEHGERAQFHVQPCDGLARAIEKSTELPLPEVGAETEASALCQQYVQALGAFGLKTGEMDTLVLGCTHYIFVKDELRALLGPDIQLVDTGAAVARQVRRVLNTRQLLAAEPEFQSADSTPDIQTAQVDLLTTGSLSALQAAAQRWLGISAEHCAAISVPDLEAASATAR